MNHRTFVAPDTSSTVAQAPVLFIDLDGTLIKTDLLHEALLRSVRHCPVGFLRASTWLKKGRAGFKRVVARITQPDCRYLPYREEVLELITEARAAGTKVVLATASDERWAQQVARELGLFDDVLASNGRVNLKGATKLSVMQNYCRRNGFEEFDYVGDSSADLPIWNAARRGILAAPSARLRSQVRRDALIIGKPDPWLPAVAKLLRPHQWAKNLLVFVPLITSHRWSDPVSLGESCAAFAAFSACASSVYVLNDLVDIDADRKHATKRKRPFAAGNLSLWWGPLLALLLLTAAIGITLAFLPLGFAAALAGYFAVTCLYSLSLKRIAMLDIITLACLYAVRVFAGGLATGIGVSHWLMAFSLFIFVSLAFAKRYVELNRLTEASSEQSSTRGYRVSDLSLLESMGPTAGYLAVLVLALYIQSEEMQRLYNQSWALWMLCPLFMYWISRLWLKAKRGELHDDPVVFALRDRLSWATAVIAAGLLALASWK